jgi:hypothetical protein
MAILRAFTDSWISLFSINEIWIEAIFIPLLLYVYVMPDEFELYSMTPQIIMALPMHAIMEGNNWGHKYPIIMVSTGTAKRNIT